MPDRAGEIEDRLTAVGDRYGIGKGSCYYEPATRDVELDDLFSPSNLLQLLHEGSEGRLGVSGHYVNVGASDGVTEDPIYKWAMRSGSAGIAYHLFICIGNVHAA